MSNRIGIDLGGTKIDAIILSATGETLFEKRVATPKTYEAVVAAIGALVHEAGDGSVGIGSPGSNSRKTQTVAQCQYAVLQWQAFPARS